MMLTPTIITSASRSSEEMIQLQAHKVFDTMLHNLEHAQVLNSCYGYCKPVDYLAIQWAYESQLWLSCALTAEGHSTDDACAVEMEKWKSLNLSDAETGR